MTLVSVVTPSFNQSAYLEQAIRSVLEQGYPEIEYMVMDGASTDGSVEIIRKYSSRLAYWASEKDSGQADAINKGMRRAKGEIVAWLNSDDYYLPGAIESAVAALEANPQAVLVYGNMLAVDQAGQTINQLRYRQLTLEDLLCFQIIGQPAVFMRRAAFEKAGGLDLDFHFMLDHQLWIKIAMQGPLVHVDQTWSAARYHPLAKNRAQASWLWARSLSHFGLGGGSRRSCANIGPPSTPRPRFCLSRRCALLAGCRTIMEFAQSLDARVEHPSADCFGTIKSACLGAIESNRNELNPCCYFESQTKTGSIR